MRVQLVVTPPLSISLFVLLAGLCSSCALLDETTGSSSPPDDQVVQQPVVLQPIFELEGLEALPAGFQLEELHIGVGAIFLDLIDSNDGVAFANRIPFRLHFLIDEGQITATAPSMTLPQGGRYQVSVQIEPQDLAIDDTSTDGLGSASVPQTEASLSVRGVVVKSSYSQEDDGDDAVVEPAPLPWRQAEAVSALQRSVEVIPFSYTSARTVRFVLDAVELRGGSTNELVMGLQVGSWVEFTIRPALDTALGQIVHGEPSTERVDQVDLDLGERLESGDGIDDLVGGIQIKLR